MVLFKVEGCRVKTIIGQEDQRVQGSWEFKGERVAQGSTQGVLMTPKETVITGYKSERGS